jgi:hypothetical protein
LETHNPDFFSAGIEHMVFSGANVSATKVIEWKITGFVHQ